MEWIVARLNEASTWRGIIALISAAGVALSPDQGVAIVTAGVALAGVINVFRKE
jgi:hypothetical protein